MGKMTDEQFREVMARSAALISAPKVKVPVMEREVIGALAPLGMQAMPQQLAEGIVHGARAADPRRADMLVAAVAAGYIVNQMLLVVDEALRPLVEERGLEGTAHVSVADMPEWTRRVLEALGQLQALAPTEEDVKEFEESIEARAAKSGLVIAS